MPTTEDQTHIQHSLPLSSHEHSAAAAAAAFELYSVSLFLQATLEVYDPYLVQAQPICEIECYLQNVQKHYRTLYMIYHFMTMGD